MAPPRFAAYGYDFGRGTWESPEPEPNLTARDWIWSADDLVQSLGADGMDVRICPGVPRR